MKLIKYVVIVILIFSQNVSAKEQRLLFDPSGHKYTTFIVSKLTGFSDNRAYIFSYYSQLPDERVNLDAVYVGLLYPFTEYRETILSTLHSLHGGGEEAVLKRRNDLSQLIRRGVENKSLKDWEIGVVIHSLGDSFSHVKKIKNGTLKAYDSTWGHFLKGHEPDIIAEYPEIYKDYLRELYISLVGNDIGYEGKLKPLLKYIPNLSTNKNEAIRQMRIQALKLGFNDIDYEKVGNVNKDQILNLLNNMEKSFF